MSLALGSDENPRDSSEVYLKLRGEEYDVLVKAAEQYGVDTDTWGRLERPALKGNNGFSQFLRLLVQGEVSPSDFRPIEAVESAEDNRFVKCRVALMPAEVSRLEESVSSGELDRSYRNHAEVAQKLRQGVVLPFIAEVTR